MRPFLNLEEYQPKVFKGYRQMIVERDCFSFGTLELKPGSSIGAWTKLPETKAEGFRCFAPLLKNLGLRLDQAYFNTHHVVEKIPRERRFDAVYTVEGIGSLNPHVHLGFFSWVPLDPAQREERHSFLLRRAHTEPSMEGPDRMLLQRSAAAPPTHLGPNIVKAIAPNALCHIRHVTPGIEMAGYLLKDLTVGDADAMTDIAFLSDFHSSRSRH